MVVVVVVVVVVDSVVDVADIDVVDDAGLLVDVPEVVVDAALLVISELVDAVEDVPPEVEVIIVDELELIEPTPLVDGTEDVDGIMVETVPEEVDEDELGD